MSLLEVKMHKGTQFTLLARFLLIKVLLTRICLVLLRVIKPLKSCMRKLTFNFTSSTCLRVIALAFLRLVHKLIRRSSVVEGLVCINTMIPVMVFRFVCTKCSLVAIYVEDDRIYSFQIVLKSFLEGHILQLADLLEVHSHRIQVTLCLKHSFSLIYSILHH